MVPTNRTSRPITIPAALLALACCFFWGANSLAIKFSVDSLPPVGVAGLRFALGLLVTGAWARLTGVCLRMQRSDWLIVMTNSAILLVQISLLNWGTAKTEAVRSTVLVTAHIVFVALLAPLVAGVERLTGRRLMGLAVCAVGLLAVFGDQLGGWRKTVLLGDAIVLCSSVVLGFRIAYLKRSVATIDPCRLLYWQAMFAVPIFLIYSVLFEGINAYNWRPSAVLAVGYQGFIVTGFCFISWTMLLKHHEASSLAVFGFTSPLFGLAMSLALRPSERATLPLLTGAVLVAVGIFLATTRGGAGGASSGTSASGRSVPCL